MENKKLFQIGEVAKLFQVSVQTLRHYEKLGLLYPEYIDPQTNYRYYTIQQFETLTQIRYLRALDVPLTTIISYFKNRDINDMESLLKKQKELIQQKKIELDIMENKINARLNQIKDAKASLTDIIEIKYLPSRPIVYIKDNLKWDSYFSLEPAIRKLEYNQKLPITFQGKVGIGISKENLLKQNYTNYDLVFILLDKEDDYSGKVDQTQECLYISIRFHGTHLDAPIYYQKLYDYIQKNSYEINGYSLEIALIDDSIENDSSKYITEIRIPVKQK